MAPPEEIPPEPPKSAAKPRAKAKAKGLSEKLPKKTRNVPPEDLVPVPLEPELAPELPALERHEFTPEQLHRLFQNYMATSKRSNRDARIGLYRQWLTT